MTKTKIKTLSSLLFLTSLYYSDNFLFVLILFSVKRFDHKRFVINLFTLQTDFWKYLREFWYQKQMIFETFSSLLFCLASKKSTTEGLSLVYLACWLFLITKKIDFEIFMLFWKLFFLLILFSIRKTDHRGFVLVCLVCSLNLEFFKRTLMTKTIDFQNLFIIMISKSL